jgi:hypothetical protein
VLVIGEHSRFAGSGLGLQDGLTLFIIKFPIGMPKRNEMRWDVD